MKRNYNAHELFLNCHFLQLSPNGLELFEAVRQQVKVPDDYSAEQLKSDMIVYLKKNREYFTVIWFIVEIDD